MTNTHTEHKSDYELGSVPPSERKGWIPIAGIWIAVGIDLSGTILGVQLGAGLPFDQALATIMVGSLLLGLLAMPVTYVGASTGLTSAAIARAVFGSVGGRIIAMAMAISALGWFGVQTGFLANNAEVAAAELFGVELPKFVFVVLGGALMTLTALWGYRSIQRLSSWSVPLLAALLIFGTIVALSRFGTAGLSAQVVPQFSFGGAVSLVMGIFVYGVIISPDIARWARTPKAAMVAGFTGFFIGNSFIVVVALVLSRVMGGDDLMRMFFTLGLGLFAMIVLTLAQWTTNTNNLYSASLSLSVVFQRLNRRVLTLVAGAVAIVAAIFGIYDAFIPFISLMGTLVAPFGGVYMAAYFIRRNSRLRSQPAEQQSVPFIDLRAASAWALGSLAAFATTEPGNGLGFGWFTLTTIPTLDALLVGFIAHGLLGLIREAPSRAETAEFNHKQAESETRP